MRNVINEIGDFISSIANGLIFHSPWCFIGWILIGVAVWKMTISYAASANVTKYGKINLSRSASVKKKVRKDGYIFLVFGLILLLIGFRDKFGREGSKSEKHYKKCTPFNEGYSACRTFDRKSIWVILREREGNEISKVEFPDSLKVIGIGLFKEGKAEVVGEVKKGKKETVGFVDTEGHFTHSKEIAPQFTE